MPYANSGSGGRGKPYWSPLKPAPKRSSLAGFILKCIVVVALGIVGGIGINLILSAHSAMLLPK